MKPTNVVDEMPRGFDLIGDKWCVALLLALEPGGARFSDLATIPGLSRRVLAERLRLLVHRDILRTERYQIRPARDRYVLTERGEQLRRLVESAAHVAAGGRLEQPMKARGTDFAHPTDELLAGDPAATERIYDETIAPLARYDHQYRTSLVTTLDTWFACDMSVSVVAGQLYTHRHTVRYRLDRIRELTGHDATTGEGSEQLALGLRARRVLVALGYLTDD